MDEIQLAADLATIKANAQHTRDTLDRVVDKLDSICENQASNRLYRKLTWLNLTGFLAAAGFNFWPKG